ncbi:MAG: hypothetical protein ABIY50_11685 [Ignavibacteria bacterium]
MGQEITTLINEFKNSGQYTTLFDGSNFSSGIYYYHMVVHSDKIYLNGVAKLTKRMLLIK